MCCKSKKPFIGLKNSAALRLTEMLVILGAYWPEAICDGDDDTDLITVSRSLRCVAKPSGRIIRFHQPCQCKTRWGPVWACSKKSDASFGAQIHASFSYPALTKGWAVPLSGSIFWCSLRAVSVLTGRSVILAVEKDGPFLFCSQPRRFLTWL